jgi:hypothetical protein
VRTVDADEVPETEHVFRSLPLCAKMVLQSQVLHDALKDLCDMPGASTLLLRCANESPFFRLHTSGVTGGCTVDIPKHSEGYLSFEVARPVTFSYPLKLLGSSLRALHVADQVFLRVNDGGMLSISHKLPADNGTYCLVSFTFMCDEGAAQADGAAEGADGAEADAEEDGGDEAADGDE